MANRKFGKHKRQQGIEGPATAGGLVRHKRLRAATLYVIAAGLVIAVVAFLLGNPLRMSREKAGRRKNDWVEIPSRPVFAAASSGQVRVAEFRDESFEVAERLVEALAGNPHALCLLGNVHCRHANEPEAVRLWRTCLELQPNFADAHHALGMLALTKADFETAEAHLGKALQIDPAWAEVPLPLAEALAGQGKVQEVAEVLEVFLKANPTSTKGWCRLGQAYQRLADYAGAKRCNLEAIALDADCIDAHYGMAMALQKLGETDQAREFLEKFRQLKSQEDRAVRDMLRRATDEGRMRTTLVNTLMTAGRVYALHDRPQEAEEHWKRAAMLDEKHCESREALCGMFFEQKRFEEALRMRKELCDLEPEGPQHWLSFGKLSIQCGRPAEAEAPFRRVIELAPQRSEGYAALAEIYMLPGRDHKKAFELARTAVDLAPTAPNYFVLTAACCKVGDEAGARSAAEQAMKLDPADPRYREAYARLQQER
jgi:tetratricopeptide (TPR) repeat protein